MRKWCTSPTNTLPSRTISIVTAASNYDAVLWVVLPYMTPTACPAP